MTDEQARADNQPTDPNLVTVRDSMLDGLGQLADYFGFSKVMGQLYAALLMSPQPLCLDEMMDLLGISKASVSMNMRTLEHLGMVRQVWVRGRGDRRKFYEAETDFWEIIANIISGREMRDVGRALAVMNEDIERLAKAMDTVSEDDKALARLYTERIQQMQILFKFAQTIMSTILVQVAQMDFDDIAGIEIHVDSEPEPGT
ncbi:MAG: helix-turn-helix domain-containing protein [Anaerolineae bacterium]|nr:helix-turn-helix domain-containing protein [Anaerolineae bacterium]